MEEIEAAKDIVQNIDVSQFTELGITWGLRLISAIIIMIAGWMAGNWAKRRVISIKRLDKTLSSFLGG